MKPLIRFLLLVAALVGLMPHASLRAADETSTAKKPSSDSVSVPHATSEKKVSAKPAKTESGTRRKEAPEPPLTSEIKEALKRLRVFKEKGQYLEAAKVYEEILPKKPLTRKQRKKFTREYEKLNEKLLFSTTLTPESVEHTVEEGDAIYLIAKKHGTTSALTKKINGLSKDTIYPGMKLKVITGTFFIRVDKSRNTLRLFLNDKPIKTYRVATGRANSTPTGEFKIMHKLMDPTWYKTGAVIPPGSPENGLGTRWLGLDHQGYGIHGTTEPQLIGRQVSHGCVRMRNEDVEELYDVVPYGTIVAVTD